MQEASERHLGGILEASGQYPGSIQGASKRHPHITKSIQDASRKHLSGIRMIHSAPGYRSGFEFLRRVVWGNWSCHLVRIGRLQKCICIIANGISPSVELMQRWTLIVANNSSRDRSSTNRTTTKLNLDRCG